VVNDYIIAEFDVRSDYAELSGHEIGDCDPVLID
jgi:hypothetical protein